MNNFKVGDLIRRIDDIEDIAIVLNNYPNEVKIRFVKSQNEFTFSNAMINEFILVDAERDKKTAKSIQIEINKATSLFEQAFEAFDKAQKIADNIGGLSNLNYKNIISIKELEKLVEDNGWCSSSLSC